MFHCTFKYAIEDTVWAACRDVLHGASDVIGIHLYPGNNQFSPDVFYELRFRYPASGPGGGYWPEDCLFDNREDAELATKQAA